MGLEGISSVNPRIPTSIKMGRSSASKHTPSIETERSLSELPSPASLAAQHGVKFGSVETTHFPSADEVKSINSILFDAPDDPNRIVPDYRASQSTQAAVKRAIEAPADKIPEDILKSFATERLQAANIQNLSKGLPPVPFEVSLAESRRFFDELQSEVPRVVNTLKELGISKSGLEVFKGFIVKAAPMMELAGYPEAILHSFEVAENCAMLAKKLGASETEILQSAIGGVFHDGLKLPPTISFINLATHPPMVHAASRHIMLQDPEMKAAITHYLGTLPSGAAPKSAEAFAGSISDGLVINNDSKWVTENVITKTIRDGLQGTPHEHLIPQIETLFLQRFEAISTGQKPPKFTPEMLKAIQSVKFETGLRSIDRSALTTAIQSLTDEHPAVLPDNIDPTEAIINGRLTGSPEQQKNFMTALHERLQTADAIQSVDTTGLAMLGNSCEMPKNMVAKALGDIDQLSLRASKLLKTDNNGPTSWHRLSNFMHNFYDNVNGVSPASQETAQQRQRDVYAGILHAFEEVTGNDLTQHLPANFAELPLQKQSDCLRDAVVGKERWSESSLEAVHPRWFTQQGVDLSAEVSTELTQTIEKHENHAVQEGEAVFQELLSKIAARAL